MLPLVPVHNSMDYPLHREERRSEGRKGGKGVKGGKGGVKGGKGGRRTGGRKEERETEIVGEMELNKKKVKQEVWKER